MAGLLLKIQKGSESILFILGMNILMENEESLKAHFVHKNITYL